MPAFTSPFNIQYPTPGDVPERQNLEDLAESVNTALGTQGPGPQAYVPTLTASVISPLMGTGGTVRTGFWYQTGLRVMVEARFRFGTADMSPGSGNYRISLPVTPDGSFHSFGGTLGLNSQIGSGVVRDDSATGASQHVVCQAFTSVSPPRVIMVLDTGGLVDESAPFTFAAGDAISVHLDYLVRP